MVLADPAACAASRVNSRAEPPISIRILSSDKKHQTCVHHGRYARYGLHLTTYSSNWLLAVIDQIQGDEPLGATLADDLPKWLAHQCVFLSFICID